MEKGPPFWRLIDANLPLWGGEATVVRSYWDWEGRTRETDLVWLARQAYKEYWDGYVPSFERLTRAFPGVTSRADALQDAKTAYEELAHYCLFADAHDALCDNAGSALDPLTLRKEGDWDENRTLMALRAEHKRLHGEIGERAHAFTEGGYCTLYAEGMKLAARGGADALIASACSRVYDDEFEHMLKGIAGLDDTSLDDGEWDLLARLTVEQSRCRIRMRNAQFSRPVSPQREAELCSGAAEPVDFDYERAGLARP